METEAPRTELAGGVGKADSEILMVGQASSESLLSVKIISLMLPWATLKKKNKSLAHQSTVFDTEQIFPWIVKDLADFL